MAASISIQPCYPDPVKLLDHQTQCEIRSTSRIRDRSKGRIRSRSKGRIRDRSTSRIRESA